MRKLLEPDYFIRPDDNDHGVAGYRLQPGSIGGQKVDEARVNEIIGGLSPLLEQKVEGFYLSVRPDVWADLGQLDRYAIVCTDLEGAEAAVGHTRWRRRLALYDRIVARQVSMFRSGDVVRPVRNGYLFVFNDVVKDAADFTTRLQSAVNWHNEVARKTGRKEDILPPQVISLEFGLATHVLRAHGDDYVGEAIHRCIGRVDLCREVKGDDFSGAIAVSDDFASPYVNELGEEPFAGRVRKRMQGWTMVLDRPPPGPNGSQSPSASMNA